MVKKANCLCGLDKSMKKGFQSKDKHHGKIIHPGAFQKGGKAL